MSELGAEDEQDTLAGKLVIIKCRREDLPLGEIRVGKFTYRVSPMVSQKSFAEAGERGTQTQPICMVTTEITTNEEERVGMSGG